MKLTKTIMVAAIALSIGFVSCKTSDADVKTNVEAKVNATEAKGVTVSVVDGVATLTGEVSSDAAKASAEAAAKEAKGVKSVVNSLMMAAPMMPPVITADDPLTSSVMDATKDFPGVNAAVSDGVIALSGEIEKAKLPMLMQALNGLNPKKIENNLTIK